MRIRGRTVALLAVCAAAIAPASASATVTIGSNLGRAPEGAMASEGCSPDPCTFLQGSLAADRTAPGGLRSPVNGSVTLWRIRASGVSSPTALRVIRPLTPTDLFTGAGTSATVTPALNATSTFPTSLPIKVGDAIGIDCCTPSSNYFLLSGGDLFRWGPILADGGPGRANEFFTAPHELVLNADVEPTSAFAISAVKSGKGGKVTVTTTLPNPGVFEGGDAAGPKKKTLLKHSNITAAVANQTIRLLTKPTKLARSRLATKSKLKAKLKLVFTPTGGSPSTQILKVKLKA